MKNLLLIIFALVIIAGCKKAEKVVLPRGIIGTWELRTIYGIGVLNFPPGNGNTLQFNQDSTYISSQPPNANTNGVFHVVKNGITLGQTKYDELYYNNSKPGQIMELQNDTLALAPPIQGADVGAAVFIRIK